MWHCSLQSLLCRGIQEASISQQRKHPINDIGWESVGGGGRYAMYRVGRRPNKRVSGVGGERKIRQVDLTVACFFIRANTGNRIGKINNSHAGLIICTSQISGAPVWHLRLRTLPRERAPPGAHAFPPTTSISGLAASRRCW